MLRCIRGEINQLFLIIYIFEKDKVCEERVAQRQESRCANMVTAGLPGSSSHNISVSQRSKKKKVLTLNIQNKVHVFSDSSSGSHNEAGVYIWIRKHTQNNFLMFGMTVCVCLSRGLVK